MSAPPSLLEGGEGKNAAPPPRIDKRPRVRRLVLELDRLSGMLVGLERELAALRETDSAHATSKQHQEVKRLLVAREEALTRIERESAVCEEAERAYLTRLIQDQRTISSGLQRDLKQAVLDARRNEGVRQRLVRRELLGLDDNGKRPEGTGEKRGAKEALKKSEEVTQSLHRMRDNMLSNTDHATKALEALRKQTTTLDDTHAKYGEYGSTLQSGGALIDKLKQRQRTDAFLLAMGLLFFFLVCAFIITKRVRPLTNFFTGFFSGADTVAVAVELGSDIPGGDGG